MSREGTKGKHLTLEERINILNDLIKGEKLSDIATKIGKDPTTVSKEIKKHRYCNKRKFNRVCYKSFGRVYRKCRR